MQIDCDYLQEDVNVGSLYAGPTAADGAEGAGGSVSSSLMSIDSLVRSTTLSSDAAGAGGPETPFVA